MVDCACHLTAAGAYNTIHTTRGWMILVLAPESPKKEHNRTWYMYLKASSLQRLACLCDYLTTPLAWLAWA